MSECVSLCVRESLCVHVSGHEAAAPALGTSAWPGLMKAAQESLALDTRLCQLRHRRLSRTSETDTFYCQYWKKARASCDLPKIEHTKREKSKTAERFGRRSDEANAKRGVLRSIFDSYFKPRTTNQRIVIFYW